MVAGCRKGKSDFRQELVEKEPSPREEELQACLGLAESHGLVQIARVLLNLNEFLYLD